MRAIYDILEEPRGDVYRALIDYCYSHTQIVLLVLREADWIEASARDFLDRFRSALIAQEEVSEWPGTRLGSDTATAFRYRATPELVNYLKAKVQGLYEWQQPEQLEDLCFLRQPDGTALLATIAHENDAYLELTSDEYDDLVRLVPSLRVMRHTEE